MPNDTDDTDTDELAQARGAKHLLAHIRIDNDCARLWVNDDDGNTVLDLELGQNPRREAIARLLAAGYGIVEVVTPTLLVVQKR